MARTALTLLVASRAGSGLSIADANMTAAVTDGHYFVNDGATVLLMLNTNAASRTVTVVTPGVVDSAVGLAVADLPFTLGAGNVTAVRRMSEFFPRSIYNQSDGTVFVDYSATAGLSVAAVRIPRGNA